ncbi:MAG: hypothetical protein IH912_01075 [Proteobacteria bacterium]|nr:hypothetical protein [Pseudomonadota bacterium]
MLDELLTTATLCSNATLRAETGGDFVSVGDPTELALLVAAHQRGIRRDIVLNRWPEVHEIAFDPETKRMATMHSGGPEIRVAVKGAPETVIPLCATLRTKDGEISLTDRDRQVWLDHARNLAERGLRTLAVAEKMTANATDGSLQQSRIARRRRSRGPGSRGRKRSHCPMSQRRCLGGNGYWRSRRNRTQHRHQARHGREHCRSSPIRQWH